MGSAESILADGAPKGLIHFATLCGLALIGLGVYFTHLSVKLGLPFLILALCFTITWFIFSIKMGNQIEEINVKSIAQNKEEDKKAFEELYKKSKEEEEEKKEETIAVDELYHEKNEE